MHALKRLNERYDYNFNEFDLLIIWLMVKLGLAKRIQLNKNKFGIVPKNRNLYHLRYGKYLLAPIMADDLKFITFLPVGKKISYKKYYKQQITKDSIYKEKRLSKKLK